MSTDEQYKPIEFREIMTNQNTNYDYCKGVEKSVVDKSALVRLCGCGKLDLIDGVARRDASLLTEGEQKEILSYIRGNYDRAKIPYWLLDLIDEIDRLTEKLALTEKKLCNVDSSARVEVKRLNNIIARLKEAGENLIQLANFDNKRAIEYTDLWSALMKELEDKNRKLRLELNAPDYHQLLRAEIDRLVDGNAKFQEMATNKITGLRADIAIRDEYIKKCRG